MYDGFEDAEGPLWPDYGQTRCRQAERLVRPYDRYESFEEQLANGDFDEETMPLMLSDSFKEGRLTSDQYLDALRKLAS